jgi:hypothetical protein
LAGLIEDLLADLLSGQLPSQLSPARRPHKGVRISKHLDRRPMLGHHIARRLGNMGLTLACRLFHTKTPQPALPMKLVTFVDPIREVEFARPTHRDAHRAKILIPRDDRLERGTVARPVRKQSEPLDPVVAPTRHEQRPAVIGWPTLLLNTHDPRRRFTRPRDHGERARQFAVPSVKGMQSVSSIAKLEAVIATLDDV